MEPKFINEYRVLFEIYKDWYKHPIGETAIKKRKKRTYLIIGIIFCSILMILFGILSNQFYLIPIGSIFLIFVVHRVFVFPNKALKKKFNEILAFNKTNMLVSKVTFSDEIIYEMGKISVKFSYSEIVKITEDECLFYLFMNKDQVLRLKKDSFVVGTVDDFKGFTNGILAQNL